MASDVTVSPTLGHAVLDTQGGVGASPGYDAIDTRRRIEAATGGQEGVFDANAWKGSQNSGGAAMNVEVDADVGLALVQGDSVAKQSRYVVAPHSGNMILDIGANSSGNPRLDTVVLQVRDNAHDGSGANDARVRVLAGTPTSGATLDNRNGHATVPDGAIILFDVLVANGASSITNSNIRDRRPWARGGRFSVRRVTNAGGGDHYQTTSTSFVDVDSTNLKRRLECSGKPIIARLHTDASNSSVSVNYASLGVDGSSLDASGHQHVWVERNAGDTLVWTFIYEYTPTAGSHLFAPMWKVSTGTQDYKASAAEALLFTVEEDLRGSADNT